MPCRLGEPKAKTVKGVEIPKFKPCRSGWLTTGGFVFIKRGAFDGNNGRRGSTGPTGLMILIVRLDGHRRAFGDRSARCIFGKQPDKHDSNFKIQSKSKLQVSSFQSSGSGRGCGRRVNQRAGKRAEESMFMPVLMLRRGREF